MQCLHDETRSAFNALVDELSGSAAAAQLGAAAPKGFAGKTVQAVLDELAGALGQLGGSLEMEDSTLVQLVAAVVERDLLDEYCTAGQVEEKLEGMGIAALKHRMDSMESALSQEGVVLGEVERMYPFTLPGAELAGAAELMSADLGNALCIGEALVSLTPGESGMMLTKIKPLEGAIISTPLSGNPLPLTDASKGFLPLWVDAAGEYLLVKAASVWYLVSLKTGACAQLVSGGENTFCGAARVGNIVTAVFHNGGSLYFYRRSVAGDSGEQPALTALDTCYESGSALDRVINVYGGVFLMLKHNAANSVLKAYEPGDMLSGGEVSTGLAGAFVHSGVRLDGNSCLFLMEMGDGSRRQAKCVLSVGGAGSAPALTVGDTELSGSRLVGGINGRIYAAAGTDVYVMDGDTLAVQATVKLPAAVPEGVCALDGAALGELWGGEYILADGWLLNVKDVNVRALRCDGAAPEGYGVQPAAQRYFAAHSGGRWYFFDSLLRPVWGMVPYVTAGQSEAVTEPKADTSAFGGMSKV